jgi:hypothetical protein
MFQWGKWSRMLVSGFLRFILALFVACSSLLLMEWPVYSQDTKKKDYKVRITWQAVEGAGGYIVEMNNDRGAQVFNRETDTNFVVPRIPAGNYTIRITVLDKFRKPADSTAWTKLIVKKSESPVFEDISKNRFDPGEVAKEVKITGGSFEENISVSIESETGESTTARNLRRVSDEELFVDFDMTGLPPGSYSLVLQNTDAKKTVIAGKIILSGIDLRIDNVSPSSVKLSSDKTTLRIQGPWFAKKSTVELRSGEKVLNIEAEVESAGVLLVPFLTEDAGPGEYDITVKSDGKEAVKKSALVITGYSGLRGVRGLTIGVSYKANIYQSDWKSFAKNSYKGGGLTAGIPFGSMPLIPWNTFTSHAGLDFSADYIMTDLKHRFNRFYGSMTAIPYTMNLYGIIGPLDFPLSLVLRAGGGAAYTKVNLNKPAPGNGTSSSTDYLWQAGGGLRLKLGESFFCEVGSMYVNTLYKDSSMKAIQGYFTVGYMVKSDWKEAAKKDTPSTTVYPGIAGLGGISIGASYKANIYLSDWKSVVKNSYIGGGLNAGIPFGSMPFVPWNIFTSRAGLDFSVDYIAADLKQRFNRWYGTMTVIPYSVNLYGSVGPLDFPLSLILRVGGGSAYTQINFSKPSPGNGTSQSNDFLWQAGGGVRLTLARSFFCEAGSMYVNTLYRSPAMKAVQGYFTAGILL